MPGSRILLVDDERDVRAVLKAVLSKQGYEVYEAADGEQALALLRGHTFDVLIADVVMPGLGGFGILAALRFGEGDSFAEQRSMPVILLSGHVTAEERARALDAGVDEFLVKPVDPPEFLARLRAVLRRAAAPQGGMQASTRGSLDDFGVPALAQALYMAGRTARVRVHDGDVRAVLDFHNGQIAHATFTDGIRQLQGDVAAVECFMLSKGGFEIVAIPTSSPRTVFDDTDGLILRAATRMDEKSAGMRR